ncbi:MAG: excinuclease ABC subunit UvrC [Chloroflexota bacterium]|nr:excinuclease ABC subunit UvrC [Chloroflexota bacterium]
MESMVELLDRIQNQIESLPRRPGVYLMRDVNDDVVYIGKTVDLRNRVRSYFHASALEHPKTRALVSEIDELEFIVTDSELEALILEANLIKKHRPRYNVRFKDDKRYPYIKVTVATAYPKVTITRRIEQDGSRYFGPYTSSSAVHETLDLLRKSFPYLTCNRDITGEDERACLYHEIKRCLGPCIGAVSKAGYRRMIDDLIRFLEGRGEEVIIDLEERMRKAADDWDYEQAASLRDQLRAVQSIVRQQKVVSVAGTDQDVIAFAREEDDACVQVFFIRGGKLLGREYFVLEGAREEDDRHVMSAFLKQFYEEAAYVPPEVLLPQQVDEALIIERWLKRKRGDTVTLRVPRRGKKRQLVKMAAENAAETLAALRVQWQADAHKQEEALAQLAEILELPQAPARIECYDISTTQGVETTGSMVVFVQGVPRKSTYRRFNVDTVDGQDDYAGMRNVLDRRFRRWQIAQSEEMLGTRDIKGWAKLPDLLLVDGGKGQLAVAVDVLESYGLLGEVAVAALAKRREEIFLPGRSKPVLLPRRSPGLFLVQRVRDEAHRFAIRHHRTRRRKAGLTSQLEGIPGIGPARRKALLKQFGSVEAIQAATLEELDAVPGLPHSVAEAIKDRL